MTAVMTELLCPENSAIFIPWQRFLGSCGDREAGKEQKDEQRECG